VKVIEISLVYLAAALLAPTAVSVIPLTLPLGTVFVEHLPKNKLK
jgi:hypothetical protein